ncbi:hypothetical protein DSUL_40090 [Desulfovibrionales bacterium]
MILPAGDVVGDRIILPPSSDLIAPGGGEHNDILLRLTTPLYKSVVALVLFYHVWCCGFVSEIIDQFGCPVLTHCGQALFLTRAIFAHKIYLLPGHVL